MGRSAVAHIAIGADPWRAVPPPDATTTANMQAADLVLEPLCPPTVAIDALKRIYAPALAGRQAIPLGRCWLGHVRPGVCALAVRRARRQCEEPQRRSNPDCGWFKNKTLDCRVGLTPSSQ
jgi:hypothetical protein